MIINFIGTRGTHPASGQGTMSFVVDNKIIFDICPEFVLSYTKFIESWNSTISTNESDRLQHIQNLYGTPSFAKIEHIFISHLHYDHWGGLRHLLIWSQMFEASFREEKPIHIYVPKRNLELFRLRLQELFQIPKGQQLNEEEFFLRYLMVEIDISLAKYVKIHAIDHDQLIQVGKYEVQTQENKHFRGSLSYKLISKKYKLNEVQREFYGIPKGPLLSKLQRESTIEYKGQTIRVEDLFIIKKVIMGYSGDTPLDKELLQWMSNCTILIHETTYFEDGELYHTESHTALADLLPELVNFTSLQSFLPVHFSERYTWEEIEETIEHSKNKLKNVFTTAPRFGSILFYDEKEEKISLEELTSQENY